MALTMRSDIGAFITEPAASTGARVEGQTEMACLSDMWTGDTEWLCSAQATSARLSQILTKLRTVVIEREKPSILWIRSAQQSLMEIGWGLEEGPPPHLEFADWPRSNAFMRRCYKDLEEGQGLCGDLEDRLYDDDDDDIADDTRDSIITVDDAVDTGNHDDNNQLICVAEACKNNNNSNNTLTVPVAQAANINNNNHTDGEGRKRKKNEGKDPTNDIMDEDWEQTKVDEDKREDSQENPDWLQQAIKDLERARDLEFKLHMAHQRYNRKVQQAGAGASQQNTGSPNGNRFEALHKEEEMAEFLAQQYGLKTRVEGNMLYLDNPAYDKQFQWPKSYVDRDEHPAKAKKGKRMQELC
ncbi:hypothetical protein CBR_g4371 [Chara braunii]|uniref:Uncharacterized protein n=1 Tax=Chara braunii TaxID=69332 RepID=A0A388KHN4_CHABU|nr:hypothetical protein CBR_g4371 [Chara braunii]|eukprot:GBG69536.1 hypothetical protein CBR_g4371 [Chara braunii]